MIIFMLIYTDLCNIGCDRRTRNAGAHSPLISHSILCSSWVFCNNRRHLKIVVFLIDFSLRFNARDILHFVKVGGEFCELLCCIFAICIVKIFGNRASVIIVDN